MANENRINQVKEQANFLTGYLQKMLSNDNIRKEIEDDLNHLDDFISGVAEKILNMDESKFQESMRVFTAVIDFMRLLNGYIEKANIKYDTPDKDLREVDTSDPNKGEIPCDDSCNKGNQIADTDTDENQTTTTPTLTAHTPETMVAALESMVDQLNGIYLDYSRLNGQELAINIEIEDRILSLVDRIEAAAFWLGQLPDSKLATAVESTTEYRRYLRKIDQLVSQNRYEATHVKLFIKKQDDDMDDDWDD